MQSNTQNYLQHLTSEEVISQMVLNPERNYMFDQRRPKQIKITVSKPKSPHHTVPDINMFEEIRDFSNRHFQSLQRAETPNMKISDIKCDHSKSLNRDYSMQPLKSSNSKNQLYLRHSMISRNSSVKSFADRSQREILSPFYKPFEIFFQYRRKSPYNSQRSRLSQRAQGTSRSSTREQILNISGGQKSVINNQQNRSITPQFATGFNELTQINKNSSNSNSNLFENSKSLQRYFNHDQKEHPKKAQSQLSHFQPANTIPQVTQWKISRNHQKDYLTSASKHLAVNLTSEFDQNQLKPSIDTLNYSSDQDLTQPLATQASSVVTTQQKPENCCHDEGQRHQVTRYALEKALKLAEVLMKEVSRLDKVVQNHKIKQDESERGDIDDVKRELAKEISQLRNFGEGDTLVKPSKSSLKNLYNHKKRKSKKNDKESQKENYLVYSSNLLADVTACVSQQNKL